MLKRSHRTRKSSGEASAKPAQEEYVVPEQKKQNVPEGVGRR